MALTADDLFPVLTVGPHGSPSLVASLGGQPVDFCQQYESLPWSVTGCGFGEGQSQPKKYGAAKDGDEAKQDLFPGG